MKERKIIFTKGFLKTDLGVTRLFQMIYAPMYTKTYYISLNNETNIVI